MSAEQLVAAAATATGPVVDGDIAGWTERVRQTASAAVVIAADMAKLLEALTDPACKTFVRRITDVVEDKGRFLVTYEPPVEYTFKGQTTRLTDIRTGWTDEPAARQLARTARAAIGQRAVFFQRNEREEGDTEAPAAGYRRLWHIEPVLTGGGRPTRPTESAPPPEAATAPAPAATPNGHGSGREPEPELPEPIPAQDVAPAEPPAVDIDPALRDGVVKLLTEAEVVQDASALRPPVIDAFRKWWNDLGRDGQAQLRKANTAARQAGGRHVGSIHNPTTVAQLKTIALLSRCFTAEAVAS